MCVTAQSINQLRGKTYRVTQISIVGAEDFYARTIQRPKELKVDSSVQEEELFNTRVCPNTLKKTTNLWKNVFIQFKNTD